MRTATAMAILMAVLIPASAAAQTKQAVGGPCGAPTDCVSNNCDMTSGKCVAAVSPASSGASSPLDGVCIPECGCGGGTYKPADCVTKRGEFLRAWAEAQNALNRTIRQATGDSNKMDQIHKRFEEIVKALDLNEAWAKNISSEIFGLDLDADGSPDGTDITGYKTWDAKTWAKTFRTIRMNTYLQGRVGSMSAKQAQELVAENTFWQHAEHIGTDAAWDSYTLHVAPKVEWMKMGKPKRRARRGKRSGTKRGGQCSASSLCVDPGKTCVKGRCVTFTACNSNAQCSGGDKCQSVGGVGMCLPQNECSQHTDCVGNMTYCGKRRLSVGRTVRVCKSGCYSTSQCGAGKTCNTTKHVCE